MAKVHGTVGEATARANLIVGAQHSSISLRTGRMINVIGEQRQRPLEHQGAQPAGGGEAGRPPANRRDVASAIHEAAIAAGLRK